MKPIHPDRLLCFGSRSIPRLVAATIFAVLFAPVKSFAHDLYIVAATFRVHNGQTLQVSFRNGDRFPASEVAPRPMRLIEARLRSSRGNEEIKNLRIVSNETLGDVVVPSGGSLQLSVQTVPNFIELPADKFEAYLKEEGLTDVIAWRTSHSETSKPGRERYTKFAKSLLQSDVKDGFSTQSLGLAIEIVPSVDPSSLHPGDNLPIRVLFHGRPAAHLQIEAARASRLHSVVSVIGRTDEEGRIVVPIDQIGKWRLHSLKMERSTEPLIADWESFWASMTFEIVR